MTSSSLHRAARETARQVPGVAAARGVGMLEFLIALLLFSTGMMGLLSAQLAGKRAGFEASQRSVATALARDVLERMRANPGQVAAYQVTGAGDERRRLPPPETDCDTTACTATQLATFDLWQWESLLLGETEQFGGESVGGLVSPRACITSADGEVAVAISWVGLTASGQSDEIVCGAELVVPDGEPVDGQVEAVLRRQLRILTYIAGRG